MKILLPLLTFLVNGDESEDLLPKGVSCQANFLQPSELFWIGDRADPPTGYMLLTDIGDEMCWRQEMLVTGLAVFATSIF